MKVLFVASEVHPLIKTGGLADVGGSLPPALHALGCDVRVLMPAYRDAVAKAAKLERIAELVLPGVHAPVALLEGTLPGTRVKIWLVDYAPAYDRPGNPYLAPGGQPWHDNAERFALLAQVATRIALGQAKLGWRPQVVHCNDWQAGLVPALLALEPKRPATVFTIHNLSYQGLFPYRTFVDLGLAQTLWSHHALEFHEQMSFIKGGIVFADRVNTVSPHYAEEIQTPEFGCGLDGLLRHRADRLSGILNGIDPKVWDPAKDPHLAQRYSARRFSDKAPNKLALRKAFKLRRAARTPLVGMVGRLVHQKGIDLVLDALPRLATLDLQLAILGTGERRYEDGLREAAARRHRWLSVRIGYDESLAHLIEGGADMFLMPSRFEPCGLNQLYSLRYGTIPIVRRAGGLADTVVDADADHLRAGTATGIVFEAASADALFDAVHRACVLYEDERQWMKLALTGMRQDFNWRESAGHYVALYKTARRDLRTKAAPEL